MVRKISSLGVAVLVLLMVRVTGAAENIPPKEGSPLPEMELLLPNNPADLKYFGLPSGGKTFKLGMIKAK